MTAKTPKTPKPGERLPATPENVDRAIAAASKPVKTEIDWAAVELHYRANLRSLKDIGKEYGVSDAGIIKRAKRDGWTRGAKSASKQRVVLSIQDPMEEAGFVYVIYVSNGVNRFCKIGMTKHFSSRLDTHQCSSPFEVCVACCYFVGNMRLEERSLHLAYAEQRVRGEWFLLSDEDLRNIAARALLT